MCVCGPVSLVYIYLYMETDPNGKSFARMITLSLKDRMDGRKGRIVWKCGSDMVDNLFFFFSFLVGCWGG